MKTIYDLFVDNPKFSLLLTASVILAGITSVFLMQRETLPPVNFAVVTVRTVYPGASSEEVQDKVTGPLEEELQGISGIKSTLSKSRNEISELSIRIDIDAADSDATVNEIQRAVARGAAGLPADILSAPVVTEVKARELPVMEMAIVGPDSLRVRDTLAERLQEKIRDIGGVSRVSLLGYRERELQVLLDREKLTRFRISTEEVSRALSSHMLNIPAGYIRNGRSQMLVRVIGKLADPDGIRGIIVRANDAGNAVTIGNLGRVVDGSADPRIITRLNGREATILIAAKNEGADSLDVAGKINAAVAAFRKQLPAGYSLEVYRDESVQIANRLGIVTFNAIAGLVAVLLVLFLFLPGRIGIASSLSLVTCTLGTISLMVALGANFNVITMIALVICIGNLVDNSVVITEHFARLRETGLPGREAAVASARQFAAPFIASTITIISAFLPMLVTRGVMGQFIRWIPIVVMIALTFALIESLTLLPARLQFFGTRAAVPAAAAEGPRAGLFHNIEKRFSEFIRHSLGKRRTVYLLLTFLIASSLAVTALFNRFELFPPEGVEYYALRFEMPAGTTLATTDLAGRDLSALAVKALGKNIVASVTAHAGRQSLGVGDPQGRTGDHTGLVLIQIRPELVPDLGVSGMLAKLAAIRKPAGVASLASSSIQGGPPIGKPLTLTLRSSNVKQLEGLARAMVGRLSRIPGVINPSTDVESGGAEHRITVRGIIAAMGQTSISGIGNQLRIALQGRPVAALSESGREYNVVVRFDDRDKSDFGSFTRSPLLIGRDAFIPLNKIADFSRGDAPSTIKSYNHMRSITITADTDSRRISSARLNMDARSMLRDLSARFPDVSAVFGGEEEATRDSLRSLAVAMLLALLGIFATLVFMFRSFTRPFLILSTIPLGIIGVLYAFTITGRPLSFMAFIGVVGLSGVVINSSIILLDYIEELRGSNPDMELTELLVRASSGRLRAVLVTGLTTVVGLVPTAFGLGGYDPILAPLTLALSWGMIVGTVLSLIWLPTGYLIFERMSGRFSRRPDPVRTGTADGPKGRVPKKKLNRARAERV